MRYIIPKSDTSALDMKKADGNEIKSGSLYLVQNIGGKTRRIPVFVRVYKSCFEHYAVMYKDQKFSLQSGFVSLKNCIVQVCDHKCSAFRVTLNDFEGTGLTFETNSGRESEDWVSALQPQILSSSPPLSSIAPSLSPVIPRSPLMPTLAEESEDD